MQLYFHLKIRSLAVSFFAVSILLTGFSSPTYEELCQQGREHLLAKQCQQAEKAYTQAVKVDPQNALAHVGLALTCRAMKNYQQAAKAASRAIAVDPKDADALVIRGTAYHALGKYQLAKDDFNKAIQYAPDLACAYAGRARVYLAHGNSELALRDFSRAIELDKSDDTVYLARAELYLREKHFGHAVRDYTEAIRIKPDLAAYRFLRGRTHFENRDYGAAIEDATEAILLNPEHAAALGLKGASLYQQGEYSKALPELDKAEKLAPMDPGVYCWRGKVLLALEKTEKAIADLSKAVKIKGNYVDAYNALVEAYEKAEKPDKATVARRKAQELEEELRKKEALSEAAKDKLQHSITGRGGLFGDVEDSQESLRSQTPAFALLTAKVRRTASSQRDSTEKLRKDAEICEMDIVVPQAYVDAEQVFKRSSDLFDAGKYEVAAVGFAEARKRYLSAFKEYEETVRKNHTYWMDWARQRATDKLSNNRKTSVWLVLAEAAHLLGDHSSYQQAMKKVVSHVRMRGVMDPKVGVIALLDIAEVQLRCNDHDGAKSSVDKAVQLCEGVQEIGPKSYRYALCAGYYARLGEDDEWTKNLQRAVAVAKHPSIYDSNFKAYQPHFVTTVAYAQAGLADQAFEAAEALKTARRDPYPPTIAEWGSQAYAWIALAAARNTDTPGARNKTFDKSYAATCAHMAAMFDSKSQKTYVNHVRERLAMADAELGRCDRAWVSAVNIANPEIRASTMALIIRAKVEQNQLDEALDMAQHLPQDYYSADASCWVAKAKVLRGNQTMVQLKLWGNECPGSAKQAMALAGIALGIKARMDAAEKTASKQDSDKKTQSDNGSLSAEQLKACADAGDHLAVVRAFASMSSDSRANSDVCKLFDRSAAKIPRWWLDWASSTTGNIEDPFIRARLWLILARVYHDANEPARCRVVLARAAHCTTDVWNQILAERPNARPGYDGAIRWRSDFRNKKARNAQIQALLGMLMALEDLQHETGSHRWAFDTLLLAIRCTETLPRKSGYASMTTMESPVTWFARIAGLARLRGRQDVADVLTSTGPWDRSRTNWKANKFLKGIELIESGNLAQAEQIADELQENSAAFGDGASATYAATLNTQLAYRVACKGDTDHYLKLATKIGGLVHASRSTSAAAFLPLAEAATMLGETEMAQEYVDQSKVRGPQCDAVLAQIAARMCEDGRIEDGRNLLQRISDDESKAVVYFAVSKAEAGNPKARLSAIFESIDAKTDSTEKAASMAGVAAALIQK